jgi:TolB protein
MNPDGSGVKRINDYGLDPDWSPDGEKISYIEVVGGHYEIFVMNADGSGRKQLTSSSGADLYQTWSPDGTKIAFISKRDGNAELYVMNADGSEQTRLTYSSDDEYLPEWSSR